MALSIARTKAGVNQKHGGIIKVQEKNEDGTFVTGAPVIDLGYLKEVSLSDKTPSEDVKDVTGNTVTQELGDREVLITGTLMQTDDAVLDIAEECRGKYYALYTQLARPGSASAQEFFVGVGTITPQFDIKFPGGENTFEYKASTLPNAISITGANLTGSGTAGFAAYASPTVTIPAGKYYKKVTTFVANGVAQS
jgi:hypothetical protein